MRSSLTKPESQSPSLMQIMMSTLMSYIGVCSPSRRKRDFEHGDPKVFIAAGFFMLLMFIFCLVTVVKLVFPN